MSAVAILLACLTAGSLAYCMLVIAAARSYLEQPPLAGAGAGAAAGVAGVSVLKPLAGLDEGLEANLRSFFEQNIAGAGIDYEILFAVRDTADPAAIAAEKLRREYPGVASRLIVTGQPPYPNAKVFSLDCMLRAARHALLVMSDSDIRVAPDFIASVAAEFSDPRVALATCLYRAIAGASLWSRLEAEGMNTEFLGGLLVARYLEGVKFAVGPTIAARRSALEAVGGFDLLKQYLAEDFVLGKLAAEAGLGVILARTAVEHRIGSEGALANARHRLRWARSTRRSRPWGYLGQIFTYPLPAAALLAAVEPRAWPALVAAVLLRASAAWATSVWILGARPRWLLLPLQDALSFLFWIAGFFGNTISWRGRRYYLHRDGRFELR